MEYAAEQWKSVHHIKLFKHDYYEMLEIERNHELKYNLNIILILNCYL